MSTEISSHETARLAWCALVALRLAQQEGRAQSELQQHLFLMQWPTAAQKQKRFPKSVASDVSWLLALGKKYGFAAKLPHKLDYLYRSTSGVLAQQNDLFRLTYCIETLKAIGWRNELVLPKEWAELELTPETNRTVYAVKALLESSYSDAGELLTPMALRFAGDISAVPELLEQCHLPYQRDPDVNGLAVVTLLPVPCRSPGIAGAGSLC
ncbi:MULTISPECIES: DUF2913 family protein [unclassified Serratia (in: enterobacteria)]|uniref:DUF2913 family protein n=1 Tax=unclassified Serratia (in: enterobacteria) TaxID=2647522 RepID=UPI001CBD012E|nr:MULTISPECIES: DUF2913 family protein [unclassified Serratia (in: enterobacteria)]